MGGWSRFEQIFDGQEFLRTDECDNALVRWCLCHQGKLVPALLPNPHTGFAALRNKPVKPCVMTLVGHDHVIEAAATGFQRFLNGMQAIQDFHEG
jgi:hypothetical protein